MSTGLARPSLINTDDIPLTVEALRGSVPKRQKSNINQALVDELNLLVMDPEARNVFRENIMGYSSVLADPNVRLPVYIEAVKYVSYKLMGDTNQEAWIKTFPQRYTRLMKQKRSAVHIRSTVACYNRGKIVASVMELSMIPSWLINQDLFQKAINIQAELMIGAKSEKVRTDAANSLLTHLKQPETTKMKLNIEVKQDDSIRELRDATMELVRVQKLNIESGAMNADEIARSKLIVGEFERVNN